MTGVAAGKVSVYLQRLGLREMPAGDADGLATLQRAHRLAIPFENLDIRLGRTITIDSESVFDKLVMRGRGGYCFEQNRLFADMLAAMGLPSRPLLARTRLGPPPPDHPPRTHVLLLTELGGTRWIADVGFGGSYVPPLPLRDGTEAATPDGARHRLQRIGERGSLAGEWLLLRAGPHASTDGRGFAHEDWQPQYSFDLGEVASADLEQANHWTAGAPSSRFTNVHIATIVLPEGFASLIDRSLGIAEQGRADRSEIAEADTYHGTLASRFRLDLSAHEARSLPLFR